MAWSFSAQSPVYLQIVSRLRADILNGVYRADTQMPAVRQLAMEAGVNPNTMQHAFAVLEAEHLFVTRGTLGRFVTTDAAVLERAREILCRETVERLIEEARAVGIEPDELIDRIRAVTQAPPGSTVSAPSVSFPHDPTPTTERSDPS